MSDRIFVSTASIGTKQESTDVQTPCSDLASIATTIANGNFDSGDTGYDEEAKKSSAMQSSNFEERVFTTSQQNVSFWGQQHQHLFGTLATRLVGSDNSCVRFFDHYQLFLRFERAEIMLRAQQWQIERLALERNELAAFLQKSLAANQWGEQRLMNEKRKYDVELAERERKIDELQSQLRSKAVSYNGLLALSEALQKENASLRESSNEIKNGSCNCEIDLNEYMQRASFAEVALLRLQRRMEIDSLERACRDADRIIAHLDSITEKYFKEDLARLIDCQQKWKSNLNELQANKATVEKAFDEQISRVESGVSLSALSPIVVPQTPAFQQLIDTGVNPEISSGVSAQTETDNSTSTAGAEKLQNDGARQLTKVEQLIETVLKILPHTTGDNVLKAVQKYRSLSPGKSLRGIRWPDLVSGVCDCAKLLYPPPAKAPVVQETAVQNASDATATVTTSSLFVSASSRQTVSGQVGTCLFCRWGVSVGKTHIVDCKRFGQHFAHEVCLLKWFSRHKSCPICRVRASCRLASNRI